MRCTPAWCHWSFSRHGTGWDPHFWEPSDCPPRTLAVEVRPSQKRTTLSAVGIRTKAAPTSNRRRRARWPVSRVCSWTQGPSWRYLPIHCRRVCLAATCERSRCQCEDHRCRQCHAWATPTASFPAIAAAWRSTWMSAVTSPPARFASTPPIKQSDSATIFWLCLSSSSHSLCQHNP